MNSRSAEIRFGATVVFPGGGGGGGWGVAGGGGGGGDRAEETLYLVSMFEIAGGVAV